MIERESTWAEVKPGVVMRDQQLRHWLVLQEAVVGGVHWLQLMSARKQRVPVQRRPDATPVTIMETTEPEAILLLGETMGAAVLHHEDGRTLPERALKVRIDVMPTAGQGAAERIRNHIDLMHGVYVGDGSTRRSVKAWNEMHEEMHTEVPTMSWAHHHEARGSLARSGAWTPPTQLD